MNLYTWLKLHSFDRIIYVGFLSPRGSGQCAVGEGGVDAGRGTRRRGTA